MTRLMVFTDEPILASGLVGVLSSGSEFQLVATCLEVARIAGAVVDSKPDILLIDLTPGVSFDVLLDLHERFPGSRIVLWVRTIPAEMAYQAMEHGIRGILRKTLPIETLVKCLRMVSEGGLWFDEEMTRCLCGLRPIALTPRESQIVSLLATGLKNKEIAGSLFISEGTVKVYLSRLFLKLAVKDRFELALLSLKNISGAEGPAAASQLQVRQPGRKNAGATQLVHSLALERPALSGIGSVRQDLTIL